jgi:hypothetical protein
MEKMTRFLIVAMLLFVSFSTVAAAPAGKQAGINVLLKGGVTDQVLNDLSAYGQVRGVLPQIRAVMLWGPVANLDAIRRLPYVRVAELDGEASAPPFEALEAEDFLGGINTWNLDAINVTDFGRGRTIAYTGAGVYVAVLDTGLVENWR